MAFKLATDKLAAWLQAIAGDAPIIGPTRDRQGQVVWA